MPSPKATDPPTPSSGGMARPRTQQPNAVGPRSSTPTGVLPRTGSLTASSSVRQALALATLALVLPVAPRAGGAGADSTGQPKSPGFSAILPPGQSGFVDLPAFLQWQNDGNCADFGPHYCDRLDAYLGWRWDDDSFRSRDRVDPGDSVETLRGGSVRIVRDAATGSPHIWGDPDPGASGQAAADSSAANLAYGVGVTEAEDRLFQMDVFRRAAQGRLCGVGPDEPLRSGRIAVDLSGDSACWLDRVRPECGAFVSVRMSTCVVSARARTGESPA